MRIPVMFKYIKIIFVVAGPGMETDDRERRLLDLCRSDPGQVARVMLSVYDLNYLTERLISCK